MNMMWGGWLSFGLPLFCSGICMFGCPFFSFLLIHLHFSKSLKTHTSVKNSCHLFCFLSYFLSYFCYILFGVLPIYFLCEVFFFYPITFLFFSLLFYFIFFLVKLTFCSFFRFLIYHFSSFLFSCSVLPCRISTLFLLSSLIYSFSPYHH